MRPFLRTILLPSFLVLLAAACSFAPGVGYHSLVNAFREHPTLWEVEHEAQSRFGEIARVTTGMTWLYSELELELPAGRYVLDFRLAAVVKGDTTYDLRLEAQPQCGTRVRSVWTVTPEGPDTWLETPEPLEFQMDRTCAVKISILGEDGSKDGWGLDWARVRACGEGQEVACPSEAPSP